MNKYFIAAMILLLLTVAAGSMIGIPCPIYFVTGYLCPGCGASRAAAALLRFDIVQALYYHPLFVAAIPLALYLFVRFCFARVRGRQYRISRQMLIVLAVFAVLAFLYGILRNFISVPFLYTR